MSKSVPLNLWGGGPTVFCPHYSLSVTSAFCTFNCIHVWKDCPVLQTMTDPDCDITKLMSMVDYAKQVVEDKNERRTKNS